MKYQDHPYISWRNINFPIDHHSLQMSKTFEIVPHLTELFDVSSGCIIHVKELNKKYFTQAYQCAPLKHLISMCHENRIFRETWDA